VPDVELVTAAGRRRLYELLHAARPLLLDFRPNADKSAVTSDFVDHAAARCTVGQWRLPVLGWLPVPAALLIRPDGYVAWASADGSDEGFGECLEIGAR
jgi:3-(3-hydroxy-phenyl)propionate hydroxylase